MELGYVGRVQLSIFALALTFFHVSEYLLAAAVHGRSNVSWNSCLISKQYIIAMVFALLEYFIEICLFPELKDHWWISNIGLVMVLAGEAIRKTGILTAGRSFTHIIRVYYVDHHELITWGIYRCKSWKPSCSMRSGVCAYASTFCLVCSLLCHEFLDASYDWKKERERTICADQLSRKIKERERRWKKIREHGVLS